MTLDWYPAIRECCAHWRDAPMLQETFDALDRAFTADNDACIDCAKAIVEVVCRIIIDELDNPTAPVKPPEEHPAFGAWVSAAVRILKLGDVRNAAFRKLISQHHKLTEALSSLRNDAGPVSHGRDGFVTRLSTYHKRAAVLSADAIVAFLHHAYLETELNLGRTREPYARFVNQNTVIDGACAVSAAAPNESGGVDMIVRLASGTEIALGIRASELLFHLDREGYIEALNDARSAPPSPDAGPGADS
jgi:hypothetical protein